MSELQEEYKEITNLWDEDKSKAFSNMRLAISYVDKNAGTMDFITQDIIKNIQSLVKNGQPNDSKGEYRTGRAAISGASITPPSPERVEYFMKDYVTSLNAYLDKCGFGINSIPHIIKALAYAHYAFVRIHPFDDGNGRTARLICDLITKKFDLKPIIVINKKGQKGSRNEYIETLEAVNKSGNLAHLELFLIDRLLKSYGDTQTKRDEDIFEELKRIRKIKAEEIHNQKKANNIKDTSEMMQILG